MVQVSLQSLCVLGRKSSKFRQNLVDVNTKYSYFEVVGKKDKSARDNLTALRHFYASFPSRCKQKIQLFREGCRKKGQKCTRQSHCITALFRFFSVAYQKWTPRDNLFHAGSIVI